MSILIGPNGAGKSNLIAFFRMLGWMLTPPGQLQVHLLNALGGSDKVLHEGPKQTPQLEASISLETESGMNEYAFRLFHGTTGAFLFAEERYRFVRAGAPDSEAFWHELDGGHREARLVRVAEIGESKTACVVHALLRKIAVFQFHDTSLNARIRGRWRRTDNRWLKEDAANLAPFLLRLKSEHAPYYARIVESLRQILPFFADFDWSDSAGDIVLQWRERGSDAVFDASQASDGMLRTMAILALLLQPAADLPAVLILDEPELGLHPFAIRIVAGLLKAAAQRVQVIVASQSAALLDHFEPADVVVVDRVERLPNGTFVRSPSGRESRFARMDEAALHEWLEEYTLADLWEKNVLGGRPSP